MCLSQCYFKSTVNQIVLLLSWSPSPLATGIFIRNKGQQLSYKARIRQAKSYTFLFTHYHFIKPLLLYSLSLHVGAGNKCECNLTIQTVVISKVITVDREAGRPGPTLFPRSHGWRAEWVWIYGIFLRLSVYYVCRCTCHHASMDVREQYSGDGSLHLYMEFWDGAQDARLTQSPPTELGTCFLLFKNAACEQYVHLVRFLNL